MAIAFGITSCIRLTQSKSLIASIALQPFFALVVPPFQVHRRILRHLAHVECQQRPSNSAVLPTPLSLTHLIALSQCAVSILNNVLIAEEARAKCLHAERDEGVLAQLLVLPALVGRATLRTQRSGMAGLAAQRSVLTLVAAKGETGRRLGIRRDC